MADGRGGSWTAHTVTTSANASKSVFGIDVDGDGHVDVLSAANDTIAWYENDGSGNFGAAQVISNTQDGAFSDFKSNEAIASKPTREGAIEVILSAVGKGERHRSRRECRAPLFRKPRSPPPSPA